MIPAARATTPRGEIDNRRRGTANAASVWNAATTHRLLTDKLRTHAHQKSGHYQKGHLSSARAQHGTFLTHDHVARVVARVWRDTRVAAAASRLNSRPAARLRTSDAHEASHPFALLFVSSSPCSPTLPALLVSPSYRTPSLARERDRSGGVAPTSAPFIPTTPQRPTPFIPFRRAVTRPRRGCPTSRGTTRHSRRRYLSRPAGRLACWLAG